MTAAREKRGDPKARCRLQPRKAKAPGGDDELDFGSGVSRAEQRVDRPEEEGVAGSAVRALN